MKTFLSVLSLAVLTVAGVQASGNGGEDTIKKTFKVRPGGTLFLDVDRGNVTIETSSNSEVHVVMERDFRGISEARTKALLENHEWAIEQDGDDVVVESRYDQDEDEDRWSFKRHRGHDAFRLKVTVLVPEIYNIDFKTGAGDVEIDDLDGRVFGRTGAGNLELGNIGDSVDLTSGSGNIDISSVMGSLQVRSGAGNIEIGDVYGWVEAHTGAGNIEVTLSEQPNEDSELGSGAGNVTVYMNEDIAVDVDAHAGIGSASSDFGLRVRGKWMSKSFSGRINGGGPSLSLKSGVGNVTLRSN